MLSPAKPRENLAGKLLVSSALVVVSLAYGFWQRHHTAGSAVAMAQNAVPSAPKPLSRAHEQAAAQTSADAVAAPALPGKPDTGAAPENAPRQAEAAPVPRKSVAMAQPALAAVPAPAAPPAQTVIPPPSPPSLSLQASLEMYAPTDAVSPPLSLVTGTPPPGLAPSLPPGTHLLDGDYLSDKHQFEWGDLVVKVSIHGGQITAAQILQYPDHRSQSLYLSQMAGPVLESEVIKTQQSQVDAVSSATDTSYAFQDAIANIIVKATRG